MSTSARRSVNWYLASGRISDNTALITTGAISGGYLCCNFGGINASGLWLSLVSTATAIAQQLPFSSAGMEVWHVTKVAAASISSGNWSAGLPGAVTCLSPLRATGLSGVIVDYEPSSNYTLAHAQAYAAYLSGLAAALAPLNLSVGFNIAAWGILNQKFWQAYLNIKICSVAWPDAWPWTPPWMRLVCRWCWELR